MVKNMISINKETLKIVKDLLDNTELYGVKVEKLVSGTTVIDTGLEAKGGYLAGLKVTEIAMGGLGKASISFMNYDDLKLPIIVVTTDYPAISLLGSQLAGWTIKVGSFFAMGSGPARALALKPKKVFEKINYRDDYDSAILLLETKEKPTDDVAKEISKACNVNPENLYLVLTSTTSIAGSVQVSGRVVETGLYRLDYLGFNPLKVLYGAGYAPIMPIHPDSGIAVAKQEDALVYGGVTHYIVDEDDEKIKEIIEKAPAVVSKDYGKPSYEILKAVGFDWSKLDPAFFATGYVTITNRKSGKTYSAGKVNPQVLKLSIMM